MNRNVEVPVITKQALPSPEGIENPIIYRAIKALNNLVSGGLFANLSPDDEREVDGVNLGGTQLQNLSKAFQGPTVELSDEAADDDEVAAGTDAIAEQYSWLFDYPDFHHYSDNSVLVVINGLLVEAVSTEITVVTDVRYDSSTHQLQKKTNTFQAITIGTETGWTLMEGGQAVEES